MSVMEKMQLSAEIMLDGKDGSVDTKSSIDMDQVKDFQSLWDEALGKAAQSLFCAGFSVLRLELSNTKLGLFLHYKVVVL